MISFKLPVFVVFVGSFIAYGSLYAQESARPNAAMPFSMEMASPAAPAHSSTPSDSRLAILDKMVGRVGAVAYIGVVNASKENAKFLPGALICSYLAAQEEDDWLFAAPLWQGGDSNTIVPGANLLSLLIQGYSLGNPESMIARQHFSYILEMTPSRTIKFMDRIKDPDDARAFGRLVVSFMKGIYESSDNEFNKADYDSIDKVVSCRIEAKLMAADGNITASSIGVSSLGVAWWLGNYRWREEGKPLREFQTRVESYAMR